MRRPTGVLLDVDGTLVDTNDGHARAWVRALAEAGVTVETAAVRIYDDPADLFARFARSPFAGGSR